MALSLDEIVSRIKNVHGEKIELVSYSGSVNRKSLFLCKVCSYRWETTSDSVFRGSGCIKCYRSNRDTGSHSYEYVKEFIENNSCVLLSETYTNVSDKLKILFPCGHTKMISFDCFQRGIRCDCDSEIRKKETIRNKTKNKILEVIESLEFELINISDFSWDSKITYKCNNGHIEENRNVREFMSRKNCMACTEIKRIKMISGKNASNWKGGRTELREYLDKRIKQWKKDSISYHNYRCYITGERFHHVHHLHSFNLIIEESLSELNLDKYQYMGEYSEEEISSIIDKVIEVHQRYPLGIPLRKDIHSLFHSLYGSGNNTPEQFYEFVDRIESGEIIINK